jgi:hypothetical protein
VPKIQKNVIDKKLFFVNETKEKLYDTDVCLYGSAGVKAHPLGPTQKLAPTLTLA